METVMLSRSQEHRHILLQWFLRLQYVFNNEHASVFIHPRHFSKTRLVRKKTQQKKEALFPDLWFQNCLFLSHSENKKDFTLSYATSVFFGININISPCIKPCMYKRQSLRYQAAETPSSATMWVQTAEVNTDIFTNHMFVCTQVPKCKCLTSISSYPMGCANAEESKL